MGKPFMSELRQLEATYSAAFSMDTTFLETALFKSLRYPLIAVGSGGSLSAAHFASCLHQYFTGKLAKVSTPLEILSLLNDGGSRNTLLNSVVLCLSAGGSNMDINRAFRALIEAEPRHLIALCARKGSPLANLANKYDYVNLIDFDLQSKKDGFLATNSLLSFLILLARCYSKSLNDFEVLPPTLWEIFGNYDNLESALRDLRRKLHPLLKREHIIVLHGTGTQTAAIDIESKFTEAALGSVQLSDYRNFAHGRHHWLAKRSDNSSVIVLAQDRDILLAKRTVKLLPPSVPSVLLQFSGTQLSSALAAVVTGFLITFIAGEIKGIDPGRPGVPNFGRRLYHLGIGKIGLDEKRVTAPIQRKARICCNTSSEILKAYTIFTRSLDCTTFNGIVLDYDGTLCGIDNRFGPLDRSITKELIRLLRAGIPVGIATGRGKSIRKLLQKSLPKDVWERVVVGYYNGAECNLLSDNSDPDGTEKACAELEAAVDVLTSNNCLKKLAVITIRGKQISLEPNQIQHLDILWDHVTELLSHLYKIGVKVVMSSHSVDVLAPGVSKRNVVDAVHSFLSKDQHMLILCIGDQGKWPGNDSELLLESHALSVDTISSNLYTCWNIAPAGFRGLQATMFYLKCLVLQEGQFRFKLARAGRIL